MSPANRFQMPMPERQEGSGVRGPASPPLPTQKSSGTPGSGRDPDPDLHRYPVTGDRLPTAEPFPKLVEVRELACARCGTLCRYESSTGVHAGSPEFLRAHPDVWMSIVVDPKTDTIEIVAACSEACVQGLLRD